MGRWGDNVSAVLNNYANGRNNFKNMSNVALGGLVAAELERQAEHKRQLEVQKQKDADAALERKLKLQEMQYKIDSLNDAREQAKLVRTLAPWQPSSGFDSETGESITRANIPLDPILQATANAGGFNLVGSNYDESKASDIEPTNIMKKAFEDSFKAISAESQDPDKYKAMSEKERQKAIDNILSPYEISYESRRMTPDIYKANKIYDRNIYNTDAKLVMNQNTNETKENVARTNAKGKTDAARISAESNVKSQEIKANSSEKIANTKKEIKDKDIAAKIAINMPKIYISLLTTVGNQMPNASHEEVEKQARKLFKSMVSEDLKNKTLNDNQANDLVKTYDKVVSEYNNKGFSKKSILDKELNHGK